MFVKAIAKELQSHLFKMLGFGTEGANVRFAELLAEDPKIAFRRKNLLSQKDRLEKIKQELDNFGLRSYHDVRDIQNS